MPIRYSFGPRSSSQACFAGIPLNQFAYSLPALAPLDGSCHDPLASSTRHSLASTIQARTVSRLTLECRGAMPLEYSAGQGGAEAGDTNRRAGT